VLIYKKRICGVYEGVNDFIILRRIVSSLSTSLAIARIRISTVRTILILALLVELVAGTAHGAAFRLSFLDQEPVLADTCQLLRQSGFSEDSVATFKKLVEHHNQNGNRVDRTKFPAPQTGYYEFRDLADFTNRLQTPFFLTPTDHSLDQNMFTWLDQNTFTCFDVACLLLRGAGCEAPNFEKDFKSKGIVSGRWPFPLLSKDDPETFRSDYHWALFPEWGYERLAGRPRSEGETELELSVRAGRHLPGPDPTNEMTWRAAFATFASGLKESGFVFPRNFKLGLGFYVDVETRRIFADHAFICIPKGGRLICLEKNGSAGPYVRAEFESEEEVARYISWTMLQTAKNPKAPVYGYPVLVSLNDRLIGVYPTGVWWYWLLDASIPVGMARSNVVAMLGNPTLGPVKCGPDSNWLSDDYLIRPQVSGSRLITNGVAIVYSNDAVIHKQPIVGE
jgi:hypothetical protein